MDNKTENTEGRQIKLQPITLEDISSNQNDILQYSIPIWRKNIENKMVILPVKKLKQYLADEASDKYSFFIEKNWKERVKIKKREAQKPESPPPLIDKDALNQELKKIGDVDKKLEQFRNMTVVEREEILDLCIENLSGFGENGDLDITSIVKMVEVITNTFYANNANLEENIKTTEVQKNVFGVLTKTNWIIQILVDIFYQNKYPYNDLKIIDEISTGSITIDHINKVLMTFITFCMFFNEYIDHGLFTKNIRGVFKDRYYRYYKKRLPDRDITIETIFQEGIRRIHKAKDVQDYTIGALLYDMGKIFYIDYHDGFDEYNEEIVKKHVLHGYNLIVQAQKYPFDVLAMAAFHHEYYGGKGSYNFLKPLRSRFAGKNITEDKVKYFISYNKNDFINGTALSYFPCKVIEIIDVFDAIICKKGNSITDTLRIMKKEFITKTLKIDPILFRIFLDYNIKCGKITIGEAEEIDKIIY